MAREHEASYASWLLLSILLPSTISALILSKPTATSTSEPPYLGVQITAQPQLSQTYSAHNLFARQQLSLATCGYINGASSAPVTCNSGFYCATTSTFVGCCETNGCRAIFTSCYDLLGDTCDQACQNNPSNLLCSSTIPYCAEYQYEGGSVGLGCAKVRGYTSTVLLTVASNIGSLTLPSSNTQVTVTASLEVPTQSVTSNVAASKSGGSLSTGATAGIAVGATLVGVVLLGLVWFIVRRKRKNAKEPPEIAPIDRAEISQKDNRVSAYSELAAKSVSPTVTPQTQFGFPQPSPGLAGPPQYSQHYDGQAVEMPDNARPQSYAPTELSSSRDLR